MSEQPRCADFQGSRLDVLCCVQVDRSLEIVDRPGVIHVLFERYYAPFLMKKSTRVAVMLIFVAALATHAAVAPQIEIGLDQKLSMPDDSYVLKYFQVKSSAICTCYR